MSRTVTIGLQIPDELSKFRLPAAVNVLLQDLLDRQDCGMALSPAERRKAKGLGKSNCR